jgi:hypothetical protein
MSDGAPVKRRRGSPVKQFPVAGDTAHLRIDWAENELGVADRTVARMRLPTIYVGGWAYILRNASQKLLAENPRFRRLPEPRPRSRAHKSARAVA